MDLLELRESLIRAKRMEATAKKQRLAIEEEIVNLIPEQLEGATKLSGLTVTRKLSRKIDIEAYLEIMPGIPEGLRCVDYTPKLNMARYRALFMVDPDLAAIFVTEKPAKPAITITEVDE